MQNYFYTSKKLKCLLSDSNDWKYILKVNALELGLKKQGSQIILEM